MLPGVPETVRSMKTIVGRDGLLTPTFLRWVEDQPDAVVLETARPGRSEFRSYIFLEPHSTIECYALEEVSGCLEQLENAVDEGSFAAGFMAYELGYAFEDGFSGGGKAATPLMWFGLYEEPWIYNHRSKAFESGEERALKIAADLEGSHYAPTIREIVPAPSMDEEEFHRALHQIKQHIRNGNTYQVNFSFKVSFPWEHCLADLYCQLRGRQRVAYTAFVKMDRNSMLSFSPELFLCLQNDQLTLRPMKGTAPRGRTPDEDERNRRRLLDSAKDRAENLMIVDLLRNDVGRIAKVGSVKVPEYYAVEEYETVYQATSVIEAELRPGCSLQELIRGVFPSGSVTGAPKIRTMQIIQELEREPRGVYTGSVGFFSPGRQSVFNVAIRTVVVDGEQGLAEMGVGSGVTYDSDNAAEYRECLTKARFLGGSLYDLELLETLRWDRTSGWFLLEEHCRRAENSASHFGFSFDPGEMRDSLRLHEEKLQGESEGNDVFRVRMVVNRRGEVRISHRRIAPARDIESVAIALQRIDPCNRFLYHKTSKRAGYDRALRSAQEMGLFDLVFLNERGEVAEGARSNVVIRQGSQHFTPPVDCGLLPGLFRQYLLDSQEIAIEERVLYPADFASADEVFLCNSVRCLQRVELVDDFSGSRFTSLDGPKR